MSIERTTHGPWRVRWHDPAAGKQVARSFRRRVDAAAFEREILSARDRGVYVAPSAGHGVVMAQDDRPQSITLTRDEAIAILATIDDVQAQLLQDTDLLGLLVQVEDAAAILIDRLYPDA